MQKAWDVASKPDHSRYLSKDCLCEYLVNQWHMLYEVLDYMDQSFFILLHLQYAFSEAMNLRETISFMRGVSFRFFGTHPLHPEPLGRLRYDDDETDGDVSLNDSISYIYILHNNIILIHTAETTGEHEREGRKSSSFLLDFSCRSGSYFGLVALAFNLVFTFVSCRFTK